MDTQLSSPNVLNERNDNVAVFTPEQDMRVVQSIANAHNNAPKSKQILPPKPLERTKVVSDNSDDSKEESNFIYCQSNSHLYPANTGIKNKVNPVKKSTSPTKTVSSAAVHLPGVTIRKAVVSNSRKPQATIFNQPGRTLITHTSNVVTFPATNVGSSVAPALLRNVTMKKVTKQVQPPEKRPPEKGRPYDPVQVKSYMEHQREARRLKERKEQEERRVETERKKYQLQELEFKRRDLIARSRLSPKEIEAKEDHALSLATKSYRARKAKSPARPPVAPPPPPAIGIPKIMVNGGARGVSNRPAHESIKPKPTVTVPVVPKKKPSPSSSKLRVDSDAQLRTTMLLQEFESVLHRECLKLTGTSKTEVPTETSKSKIAGEPSNVLVSASTSSKTKPKKPILFPSKTRLNQMSSTELASIRELAAARIQSAYRGYKIRKIWREVNEKAFRRNPRRISFYRSRSAQPTSDVVRRRLPLMSPPHSPIRPLSNSRHFGDSKESKSRTAFGVSLEVPYIPPPSGSGSNIGIFNSPKRDTNFVLSQQIFNSPRLSLGGARRSNRFDEPFPKEALKQLASQSPYLGSPASSDHFLRKETNNQVSITVHPRISDLLHPTVPTFSMVLKEKVRLLQEMQQKSATSSGTSITNDRTPVKRSSRPLHPPPITLGEFDSDSTQHASIHFSSTNQDFSSADATITDDYIGPGTEAMQVAYKLRKSIRQDSETKFVLDRENNTIPSSFTFSSDTENENTTSHDYVTMRRRRGQGIGQKLVTQEEDSLQNVTGGQNFAQGHTIQQRCVSQGQGGQIPQNVETDKQNHFDVSIQTSLKETSTRTEVAATKLPTVTVERDASLGRRVADLQAQVNTIDAALAKISTPPEVTLAPQHAPAPPVETVGYMLEFAKCQTESLKATAEIQQWLADLRQSSTVQLRESRQQETINIVAAVYAAVEESKRVAAGTHRSTGGQNEAVQTTDSLLQNEFGVKDDLMGSSRDESVISEDDREVLQDFLTHQNHMENRNFLVERFLQNFKADDGDLENLLPEPNFNSVMPTSLPSHQFSVEFPPLSSNTSSTEDARPMITFADVLREVKLLAMLSSEAKAQKLLVTKVDSRILENSKSELPSISYENDFESEPSERTETANETEEDASYNTKFELFLEESEKMEEKISELEESEKMEEKISELEESEKMDENILELEESEKMDEKISELEESEKMDEKISELEESEKIEENISELEESEKIEEKISELEESEKIEEHISELEESERIEEKISKLEESEKIEEKISELEESEKIKEKISELEESEMDEKISEFEEPEKTVEKISEFEDPEKTVEKISEFEDPEKTNEKISEFEEPEKTDEKISEFEEPEKTDEKISEFEEPEKTDEKISKFEEPEKTDEKISEFEEPEKTDEKISEFEEPEKTDEKISEFEEPEKTDEKISELEESQKIDEKISELEEFEKIGEKISELEESEMDEKISEFVESEKMEEEISELEKSEKMDKKVSETEDSEKLDEEIPELEESEKMEAKISELEKSEKMEEKISEVQESEKSLHIEDFERSFSPPPPLDLTPTDQMITDMEELKKYQATIGFPGRKPCRKWSSRPREIEDYVAVVEMLEENRSWIDLSQEVAQVTENLVDTVFHHAVVSTIKSISEVLHNSRPTTPVPTTFVQKELM